MGPPRPKSYTNISQGVKMDINKTIRGHRTPVYKTVKDWIPGPRGHRPTHIERLRS